MRFVSIVVVDVTRLGVATPNVDRRRASLFWALTFGNISCKINRCGGTRDFIMPRMSAAKKRDLLKFAISAGVAGGYLIVQGPLINAYRNYKVACSLSGVINGMPGQGIKT